MLVQAIIIMAKEKEPCDKQSFKRWALCSSVSFSFHNNFKKLCRCIIYFDISYQKIRFAINTNPYITILIVQCKIFGVISV